MVTEFMLFSLNLLHSSSLSQRPCSLAVALHARFHGFDVGVAVLYLSETILFTV